MITISHLYFGFGPRDLFTDLDLTVNPGQIYGLLGRNAQGKGTDHA